MVGVLIIVIPKVKIVVVIVIGDVMFVNGSIFTIADMEILKTVPRVGCEYVEIYIVKLISSTFIYIFVYCDILLLYFAICDFRVCFQDHVCFTASDFELVVFSVAFAVLYRELFHGW